MSKTIDLLKKVEFHKRDSRPSAEKVISSSKSASLGGGLSFKIGLMPAVIFLIVLVFSFGIFLAFKNYNVQKNFMFSKLDKIEEGLRNNVSLLTVALVDIKKLSTDQENTKTKISQLEKDINEKNSEFSSNFKKIGSALEKSDSKNENNYKQIKQLGNEISEQGRLIKNLEKERAVLSQNITKLESRFNDLVKQDNKTDSKQ